MYDYRKLTTEQREAVVEERKRRGLPWHGPPHLQAPGEDRVMRSERHYFASLNYIHNNPVKHRYVDQWQDWPFSSVHGYLESKGCDWLVSCWQEFPVLNYGDTWDVF